MLTELESQDLSDIYKATGVPFVLVDSGGAELAAFPYAFAGMYAEEFVRKMISDLRERRPKGVMIAGNEELFYVAVTEIKEAVFLITAPISNVVHNSNAIVMQFAERIRRDRVKDFVRMLSVLPEMSNYQLSKVATLAKRMISGEVSDGTTIDRPEEKEDYQRIRYESSGEPRRMQHQPYEYESEIYSAVAAGDEQQLTNALAHPVPGSIGRMSLNALRQAKYQFICAAAGNCRAAIRGGLAAEQSFELCDSYCQRMDGMNSVVDIGRLQEKMAYEYCRLVRQSSGRKNYSATTKLCCDYIREHLYDRITIEDLTALAHLNRRSLSIYFKQDTGKGIPDYIKDMRLEEAKFLLMQTDMSLSEISELLQFCNQSYFCMKFKEYFGVSPNSMRRDG